MNCKCFCTLNGNGDFQIWNYDFVNIPIRENKTLQLSAHFKWGDSASKLYNKHFQVLYINRLGKYLALSPGYRQVWLLNQKDQWKTAYTPMCDLTFHFTLCSAFIKNRNRILLHLGKLGTRSTTFVYRNLLHIAFPWEWSPMKLKPFTSYELFWVEGNGISQHRINAGLHFKIFGPFFGSLSYQYRLLNISSFQTYQNVLEISARINF
ncbi:MAG: DUF2490 domain-containing protein [Simkaniaceae bacterium]|nr:DUF2490 domain-containing protein [Simkaniaceae bacterium]